MTTRYHRRGQALAWALLPISLAGCLDTNVDTSNEPLPQLSAASAGTLSGSCDTLASRLSYANTTFTSSATVAAGTLTVGGTPVGQHCVLNGQMYQRVSPVDGQAYAIGFQMRLPLAWNGRFFHQVNGGTDGVIGTASGGIGGGGPLTNGLQMGFAVITSDSGHSGAQNPLFGLDPQARLDYGYQAVGKLTPMAKAVIAAAYGRGPDRSYLVGCSNGGRHAMVGAARYADQYDGILAGHPGFNLPKAAVAQLYGAQQLNPSVTNAADFSTSFTQAERNTVATAILGKCDALDGSADGLVQDVAACRSAFNLARDVPTCSGARDGTCLTAAQKTNIGNIYTGARNSSGAALYASFPYDPGMTSSNWAGWKFQSSIGNARDPVAVGFIFSTPPAPTSILADTKAYALAFNMDTDAPKISATNATYTESSLSFMTPPNPSNLSTLKYRGAKLIAYHGLADGVFSPDDTTAWYDSLATGTSGGNTATFARLFLVPGMNHCGAGPATDQFNLVDALVKWVEQGQAPTNVVASARGTGNAGGANADVPAGWSAARTRPLCAYPAVARYKGSGSIELADSFSCQSP